jgi:hypothetical protein
MYYKWGIIYTLDALHCYNYISPERNTKMLDLYFLTRLKLLPVLTREPYTSLLHIFAKLGKTRWGEVALRGARRGLKCYSVFAKNVSVFAENVSCMLGGI